MFFFVFQKKIFCQLVLFYIAADKSEELAISNSIGNTSGECVL